MNFQSTNKCETRAEGWVSRQMTWSRKPKWASQRIHPLHSQGYSYPSGFLDCDNNVWQYSSQDVYCSMYEHVVHTKVGWLINCHNNAFQIQCIVFNVWTCGTNQSRMAQQLCNNAFQYSSQNVLCSTHEHVVQTRVGWHSNCCNNNALQYSSPDVHC